LGMTAAMGAELDPSLYPGRWAGRFGEVLPHVRDAFDRAAEKITARIPERFRDQLSALLLELCDPDPGLRGDPRARARNGNPYSLERYISRLDLLAREAEFVFKRSLSR
jgi:eukaryotic-like serine/threonine-protein kinase